MVHIQGNVILVTMINLKNKMRSEESKLQREILWGSEFYVSVGYNGQIRSNIILDVFVRVFLDEINI